MAELGFDTSLMTFLPNALWTRAATLNNLMRNYAGYLSGLIPYQYDRGIMYTSGISGYDDNYPSQATAAYGLMTGIIDDNGRDRVCYNAFAAQSNLYNAFDYRTNNLSQYAGSGQYTAKFFSAKNLVGLINPQPLSTTLGNRPIWRNDYLAFYPRNNATYAYGRIQMGDLTPTTLTRVNRDSSGNVHVNSMARLNDSPYKDWIGFSVDTLTLYDGDKNNRSAFVFDDNDPSFKHIALGMPFLYNGFNYNDNNELRHFTTDGIGFFPYFKYYPSNHKTTENSATTQPVYLDYNTGGYLYGIPSILALPWVVNYSWTATSVDKWTGTGDVINTAVTDFEFAILSYPASNYQDSYFDDTIAYGITPDNMAYTNNLIVNGDEYINYNGNCYASNQLDYQMFIAFPDVANYIKWLAWLGISATDDPNKIQTIDGAPEIPTNPTPDIPSTPTLPNDDFVTNTPNITPSDVITSHVFDFLTTQRILTWFTKQDFYDNISKLFNNPLSAIIGLKMYPFDIVKHDTGHVTPVTGVTIVNVTNNDLGGYKLQPAYNAIIHGGSISFPAYYGNYADWSSTKYEIYIPFVGVKPIDSSAVVNRTITIDYAVDFVSGNATALIRTLSTAENNGRRLVGVYPCNLSFDIPITYDNYNQQQTARQLNQLSLQQSVFGGLLGLTSNPRGGGTSLISSTIDFLTNDQKINLKTPLEAGAQGTISPATSLYLPLTAYLLIHRKVQAIPASGWTNVVGSPSSYYGTISSAVNSGKNYVQVDGVKLNGIVALDAEKNEIVRLLKAGVYL